MSKKPFTSPYVWCEACKAKVLKLYHRCKGMTAVEQFNERMAEPQPAAPTKLPDRYKVATEMPGKHLTTDHAKTAKRARKAELMRKYRAGKRGQ